MTLLEQLAKECFRQGKPLAEIIEGLVESQYNHFLNAAKNLIREGKNFETVRDILVGNDLPVKIVTSITFEAQDQVAKEVANENLLRKATESAITLLKNGVRSADCVNNLLSQGCPRDLAERIVKDNSHFYRA
jgi:hypothetical protein